MKLNKNGYDDDLYANPMSLKMDNDKQGEGQAEVNKMRANPMQSTNKTAGGSQGNTAGGKSAQSGLGSFSTKSGGGSKGGSLVGGGNQAGGAGNGQQNSPDKGGKFDITKSFLNKFKFKLQKNTREEEKTEAEVNRCNPCNEFKAGNGLDFGCIDWGKCAFLKPCCKKFPQPCSCFAYMCVGITVVGGLVSSIILF